jgi:hypothetical protein
MTHFSRMKKLRKKAEKKAERVGKNEKSEVVAQCSDTKVTAQPATAG